MNTKLLETLTKEITTVFGLEEDYAKQIILLIDNNINRAIDNYLSSHNIAHDDKKALAFIYAHNIIHSYLASLLNSSSYTDKIEYSFFRISEKCCDTITDDDYRMFIELFYDVYSTIDNQIIDTYFNEVLNEAQNILYAEHGLLI